MTLTQITEKGIKDGEIVNADINASAAIAKSKLASLDIVNADINASAAIAGTKISPDFGSQNVATTGTLGVGNTTISSTAPFLTLNDTDTENDFSIQNADGTFRIRDIDAASNRMTLDSSGQFTFATNVDFSSGIDVTGVLTVADASGSDPTMQINHSDADVTGEFIRVGRTDLPAIRYHSIKAKHSGGVAGNILSFNIHDCSTTTSQTEVLTLLGNGNVGIGTTSPNNLLHIKTGTSDAITPVLFLSGSFADNDGSEGTAIDFGTGAGTEIGARIIGSREVAGARGALRFCTGREVDSGFNNGRMVIDASGNVGIGTTDVDGNKLAILSGADGVGLYRDFTGSGGAGVVLYFGRKNSSGALTKASSITGVGSDNTGTAGEMRFSTVTSGSLTEKMRITSTGRVGINESSPTKTLVISEDDSECVAIIKSSDGGTAGLYLGGQTDEIKGGMLFDNSTNTLSLQGYNNGTRAEIDTSGNFKINSGNLVIGTAGKGIDFSATSDAPISPSSEILDEYEEGTWAPTLHDSSGNNSSFGTVTNANYTRIGNTVRLSVRAVNMSSSGMVGSSAVYLRGLPFATDQYQYAACWIRTPHNSNWGPGENLVLAICDTNQVVFQASGGSSGTTFTWDDVTNNQTDLFMTLVYKTT